VEFKDYYDTLGVPPGADADVIKSAYRKLARKFHPDVSKEKNAEERFKAVNEAYEVLKDPAKRQAYDQLRARGYRPGEEFRPPPGWGPQDGESDFGDFGQGAGFSDFFDSLFGRFRGTAAGGAGASPGAGRARGGRDVRARLEIELEQAHAGATQRVQVGARTLDVRIPAGVLPGQTIRLAGQGEGGGDLLLEVQLKPHPRFALEGRDVTARLPLAPWEAALGCEIAVPTLAGSVDLKIPPGSSAGRRLRLKGRGLPGTPPGDQYVVLEIQTPPADDDESRRFYQRMAEQFARFAPRSER
jgi:curved DNA-binding protein